MLDLSRLFTATVDVLHRPIAWSPAIHNGVQAGLRVLQGLQAQTQHWQSQLMAHLPSSLLLLYWGLLLVMGIGVIGAVAPAVPGTSLILGAILIWGWVNGLSTVAWPLGVAIFIFLLCLAVDFFASVWGAQKAGVSRWGQIGAIIGLFAGVFGLLPALPVGGPIVGLFLGPFLGAFIGELLYRRQLRSALKAAIAVVLSALIGNLVQGGLAVIPIVIFVITTWPGPQ